MLGLLIITGTTTNEKLRLSYEYLYFYLWRRLMTEFPVTLSPKSCDFTVEFLPGRSIITFTFIWYFYHFQLGCCRTVQFEFSGSFFPSKFSSSREAKMLYMIDCKSCQYLKKELIVRDINKIFCSRNCMWGKMEGLIRCLPVMCPVFMEVCKCWIVGVIRWWWNDKILFTGLCLFVECAWFAVKFFVWLGLSPFSSKLLFACVIVFFVIFFLVDILRTLKRKMPYSVFNLYMVLSWKEGIWGKGLTLSLCQTLSSFII